jgi:outer membrane cobalamin receptor
MDGAAEIVLSYTYTDARKRNSSSTTDSTFNKQLPFIPQNLLKAVLSLHFRPFTLNMFRIFTGARPVNEDNKELLPAYSVTNANIMASAPFGAWKVSAKVEVDNIFNVQYQVYPAYPMPGRTFKLDVGVEY